MADFVGLLKKTIGAQSNVTPQLRQRIYARTWQTVEKKLSESHITPEIAAAQRKMVEKAIHVVEEFYNAAETRTALPEQRPEQRNEQAAAPRPVVRQQAAEQADVYSGRLSLLGQTAADAASDQSFGYQKARGADGAAVLSAVTYKKPAAPVAPEPVAAAPDVKPAQAQEESQSGVVDFLLRQRQEPRPAQAVHAKPGGVYKPGGALPGFDNVPVSVAPAGMQGFPSAKPEDRAALPADFFDDHATAAGALPPVGAQEAVEPANNPNGDFDLVSDIFAQAAMREQKRSGKRRLALASGIIVVILCLGAAIAWFLTGFLHPKEDTEQTAAIEVSNEIPLQQGAAEQKPVVKWTQRLLPDGSEVDTGAAGAPLAAAATGVKPEENAAASAPVAEAMFYEARTDTLPETSRTGTVEWSILNETSDNGETDMAIRGKVLIPDKNMQLLITLRRNTDVSIPAAFLAELIFVVPENFDGGAIERVGQLMFKPSEQSAVQDLQGMVMPFPINENFFIVTINAPRPLMEHNLNIMRQLPWLKLVVQYKNGRFGEFSIAKGETGDAIFKKVIDYWRAKGYNIYNLDAGGSGAADTAPAGGQ